MAELFAPQIIDNLRNLIEVATTEAPIQEYLEKYPFLVSGSSRVKGKVVISQFPLGADFKADFAYVISNSGGTYLVLIEIERPDMRIFLDNDEFTQPYNHAFQQLQDWASWCT